MHIIITDANSNQTAFTYDAFGRVTQTNFPSSLSENYQYDADNNLTRAGGPAFDLEFLGAPSFVL